MKILLPLLLMTIVGCHQGDRIISGTFTVDGKREAGVQVYLPSDVEDFSRCGDSPLVTTTNEAGEFRALISRFPVRPCFVADGVMYSTFAVLDDGTDDEIHISCELPLLVTGHFEDGSICSLARQ